MRWLKWILTALPELFVLSAGAAPTLPRATSFYRAPDSLFASGQTTRANLEKNRLRSEFILQQRIKWNGREYVLATDDLVRDLQCASIGVLRENSAVLAEMRGDSQALIQLSKGAEVEILETRQHWARVHVPKKNHDGWMPLFRLEAKNDDVGVFVTIIETSLREQANDAARLQTTIPRRMRLQPLGYHDGWLRVSYRGNVGFVDAHHLVGRGDFATWAWRQSKNAWTLISHREGTQLRGKNGEIVPLTDVTAYAANAAKGIVTQMGDAKLPPLRAHAEIVKVEATRWGISRLDGHDEVWWRQDSLVMDEATRDTKGLTTDELLRRDVFSYALSGTKKLEGLASARGVWRTLDGVTWTKIENFGDQDQPVAVDSKGTWYVGGFRSIDKGQTFESFIRWESLTKSIESALARPPRYVKLQKIEVTPSSKIQIMVDTGIRRLMMSTHVSGNVWKASR